MFLVGRAIKDKDVVPDVLVLPEDVPSISSNQAAEPSQPEKTDNGVRDEQWHVGRLVGCYESWLATLASLLQ